MLALLWLPDWAANGFWVVPVMGLAVCGLAWMVGRRFLVSSEPVKASVQEAITDDEFLQGVTRDRRCAPRRKGNTIEIHVLANGVETPLSAWVLDRSIGGLCFLLDAPVESGTMLKVRPRKSTDQFPWTEVTVRSCRPEGAQYEIGCQFHRTPNWAHLVQFG
jgi:hypothetical protein